MRKLVLSTQNIAKEQKLRAKVESERDEFREKIMYWQKQAQESLSSTNFQVRKRDSAIAVRGFNHITHFISRTLLLLYLTAYSLEYEY